MGSKIFSRYAPFLSNLKKGDKVLVVGYSLGLIFPYIYSITQTPIECIERRDQSLFDVLEYVNFHHVDINDIAWRSMLIEKVDWVYIDIEESNTLEKEICRYMLKPTGNLMYGRDRNPNRELNVLSQDYIPATKHLGKFNINIFSHDDASTSSKYLKIFKDIPFTPTLSNAEWVIKDTITFKGVIMDYPYIKINSILMDMSGGDIEYFVDLNFSWDFKSMDLGIKVKNKKLNSIHNGILDNFPEAQYIISDQGANKIVEYIEKSRDSKTEISEFYNIYKSKKKNIKLIRVKNFIQTPTSLDFVRFDNIILDYDTPIDFDINEI